MHTRTYERKHGNGDSEIISNMPQQEAIKLFEQAKIRTVWDEDQEKWFFSVVDVVEVLTDSANPTDYLKKMRKRDPELGEFLGTNCPQVQILELEDKEED